MKIRNGFISNSSSSSFILNNATELTTLELAKEMIIIRDKDWEVDRSLTAENIDKLFEKVKKANINEDISLTFVTTNYETIITKQNNNIYVSTCNNHGFFSELPERVLANSQYDDDQSIVDNIIKNIDIWDIDHDILIRYNRENKYQYCNSHYNEKVMCSIDNKTWTFDCPRCYSEKIGGSYSQCKIQQDNELIEILKNKKVTFNIR